MWTIILVGFLVFLVSVFLILAWWMTRPAVVDEVSQITEAPKKAPKSIPDIVAGYTKHILEGWTLLLPTPSKADLTELTGTIEEWSAKIVDGLGEDFQTMFKNTNNALPSATLAELQRVVPIFLINHTPNYPVMAYAPDHKWLQENNFNHDWAQSVTFQIEGTNWRDYIKDQPGLLLHEMSHAFMHLFWGDSVPGLSQAYQKAVDGGSYDAVLYVPNGERKKAYALTNEKEYFAELSEAFFMKNDFAPVDRQELKTFDPTGYDVIERAWTTK